MNLNKIFSNALLSILQVIVLSGTLFYLYRFLLNTIGAEKIGVWALVLASVSFSQVASLGLGASIVKFVAKYLALEEEKKVSSVIETTLIAITVILGVALVIIYPGAKYLLILILDQKNVSAAIEILPLALFSVMLISLSGVITGTLDGYQRFDIRVSIVIFSSILYVVCCVYLVDEYGLMGLAYAQIIQYVSILILGMLSVRTLVAIPLIPYRFDKEIFREMFRYSINFQIISLTTMFLEPTTKGLLAIYGGVQVVGFYEMASKLVLQLRSLIVTANQVVVPVVAHMVEKSPSKINNLYVVSMNVMIFLATPLFFLLGVVLYLISKIWLGYIEITFIISGYILLVSWLTNTLIAPAFFAYLGSGQLRVNVISHVATAILNFSFGWMLGSVFGWPGVIIGWAISSVIGSVIIITGYHLENNVRYNLIINKYNVLLLFLGFISIITSYFIINNYIRHDNLYHGQILSILVFLVLLSIPIIKNPTFMLLKGYISNKISDSTKK